MNSLSTMKNYIPIKEQFCFPRKQISLFESYFLIISYSCSKSEDPELSIVTDKDPGVVVLNGLT
jgi:hypothetical protein